MLPADLVQVQVPVSAKPDTCQQQTPGRPSDASHLDESPIAEGHARDVVESRSRERDDRRAVDGEAPIGTRPGQPRDRPFQVDFIWLNFARDENTAGVRRAIDFNVHSILEQHAGNPVELRCARRLHRTIQPLGRRDSDRSLSDSG